MFLNELILGALLICLTVVIHAIALDRILISLEHAGPAMHRLFGRTWKVPILIFTALGVFCAHIVQIWIWAFFYLYVDALPDLETALYFSTTTFTTLGIGDVSLEKSWRLMSAFQAANGFLLFGWSTAFIFEIMSKLYKKEKIRETEQHK